MSARDKVERTPVRKATIILALLAAGCFCASASRHHRTHRAAAQPGAFDFYVFVLSWSPEFCHTHPSAAECSSHRGFLVHGLWPQNNDGTYPLHCQTNQPAPTNPGAMSDIMPAEIIQHEWIQHGTCSGLSGDQYFALIRKLYTSIRVPDQLKQPSASFTISTSSLKHAFEQINPGWNDAEMAVQLSGNYLNAVEICESKSAAPAPVACSGIRDTRSGTFVVPPVR